MVVASKGGAPENPGWYENLRADPNATIEVRGDEIPVVASTASGAERARLWSLARRSVAGLYDDYQQKTDREIPVVVLRAGRRNTTAHPSRQTSSVPGRAECHGLGGSVDRRRPTPAPARPARPASLVDDREGIRRTRRDRHAGTAARAACARRGPRGSSGRSSSRRRRRRAADALGLRDVGDLLEHVPRARREARTIGALAPGETATVLVEVRAIAARPVRRRGMRPLVEATVADATGPMKATFFNQPWLAQRYRPGTRLVLHGKYEGRNRFRVANHATTDEAGTRAPTEVSHYAATEGLSSTQILALVTRRAGGAARRRRPAAGAAARARPAGRARRGARGDALRRDARAEAERGASGWPSRSCCTCSSRCSRGARAAGRGRSATALDARATS